MQGDSGQKDLKGKTEAFLHEFFGKGEVFVRQLIAENERLRRELNAGDPRRPESPEITPASVVERLICRVAELEQELERISRGEGGGSKAIDERLDHLESENYHLAAMYVAGLQFHAARSLADVTQTCTEILLNFVGMGAFTLFLLDEERQVLFPLAREGGELEETPELRTDTAPIADMIKDPRPWGRGDPAITDAQAIMYLPLVSAERLLAVIRLEGFLSQKSGFEDNDYSLLSLISEHAGIAIEVAWVQAHARTVPIQRQAVEHLMGA